jgi:hypothetical protein
VNQDEDDEHVTIRIVKNPAPIQTEPRYKVNEGTQHEPEPLKNKRVQTRKRHASEAQTQSEAPEPREIFTQTKVKLRDFLPLAPKSRVLEGLYVQTKVTEWTVGPPARPAPTSISCQTERESQTQRMEFETQTTLDTTQSETQTERGSLGTGETQTDTVSIGVFETQTEPCPTREVTAQTEE